jgi:hypothetical protein
MSALEALIATSGEAPMLDSLDFSLPPSSSAVVDKRSHVRAYPTSASSLSVSGTRVFRIRLGGDDFCDPASVRLQYTLNNLDASNKLSPTVGPWGVWSQAYLRSSGTLIDDIPQYGRFHQQFLWNQLPFAQQWTEAAVTGWSGSWQTSAAVAANVPSQGTIPDHCKFRKFDNL